MRFFLFFIVHFIARSRKVAHHIEHFLDHPLGYISESILNRSVTVILNASQDYLSLTICHFPYEKSTGSMDVLRRRNSLDIARAIRWEVEVVAIVDTFQEIRIRDGNTVVDKIKFKEGRPYQVRLLLVANAKKVRHRKLKQLK